MIPALWPGATGHDTCFVISPAQLGHAGVLDNLTSNSKVSLHFSQ
jgi:hypothetical protein